MEFVGIDGCRAGWLAIAFDEDSNWSYQLFPGIFKLWEHYKYARLLLIDIPIGLPENGYRECDIQARRLLKKRGASIFFTPVRPVLNAADYEEACQINYILTGKKISLQVWNILPKIKEVDTLLTAIPDIKEHLRESHPEICFWSLAGGRWLHYSKKTDAGYIERLEILRSAYPNVDDIVDYAVKNFKRNQVAQDDILDALCLSITAAAPPESLVTIPAFPKRDSYNLPMEIVYSNHKIRKVLSKKNNIREIF